MQRLFRVNHGKESDTASENLFPRPSRCGILRAMETELSKKLGIEHAIFGFTPFPAVAAAITRAGGFGVLERSATPPPTI